MTETTPAFHVWLGDGWPGPYVVTYKSRLNKHTCTIVVHGATDMADAAERATKAMLDAFPTFAESYSEAYEMSVVNAHMVEADGTVSTPHPSKDGDG